ncbi:MAG: PDZ domain-containing protein [Anaerolineales bacterium]|nr:PDZ domain-containing protein [Anaerolineales bacterium]
MTLKRIGFILLIASTLACNFVTRMVSPATSTPAPTATFAPTATATPEPLVPAYIPASCSADAIATIPPATALAQPTPILQANPEVEQDLQLEIFDDVVQIVEEVYIYPDFNGKDWPGIVDQYRAQVEAGLSTEDFYIAIKSMLFDLGDEHSYFESPVEVAQSEADLAGNNNYVGVGVYVLPQIEKNQVAVISVYPNSPAEYGGLKPHDTILEVDGVPIISSDGQSQMFLVRGPECSAEVLTVRSPGGEVREVILVRELIQSSMKIDARLVPTTDGSRIGYIFIPTFYDQTIPGQIADALRNFGPLDGLILDNRLNGGGSSSVVEPILSFFASGKLGDFVSRTDSRPFRVSADPIENSQEVPLVIMVSEETASFGEIFSGVLRDTGRAQIVGQTSFGNVELLFGYEFDDGSQLWIAQETFDPIFSDDNWEQTGIIPDLEAHADWDEFVFETDPAVAAALSLLGHQ